MTIVFLSDAFMVSLLKEWLRNNEFVVLNAAVCNHSERPGFLDIYDKLPDSFIVKRGMTSCTGAVLVDDSQFGKVEVVVLQQPVLKNVSFPTQADLITKKLWTPTRFLQTEDVSCKRFLQNPVD